MEKKPVYERLLAVDRKWLYLLMLLSVMVPFLLKITYNTYETKEVSNIYDEIEKIYQYNTKNPGEEKAILLGLEYSPGTNAELDPMVYAILRHAFLRKVPVLAWTAFQDSLTLIQNNLSYIAKDYGAVYGEDYVYLGFAYPWLQTVIASNTSFTRPFVNDYYNNPTKNLSILKKVPNFSKVELVISISGTAYPRSYVTYVNGLFKKKLAVGSTAVSAAEFYPFYQTGQMLGLMGGLKGAAEYEQMVERLETSLLGKELTTYMEKLYSNIDTQKYKEMYYTPSFKQREISNSIERRVQARRAMAPQAGAHFLVIILIIIGNVCYFMRRKNERNS